jgi:hypothetical protein
MVNAPGDAYEQEADRVAEQVMRMAAPAATASPAVSGGGAGVQHACACGGSCDDCKKEHHDDEHAQVQMKAVGPGTAGGIEAPPIVHEVLRSPGQPLDAGTRAFIEPRFGHDFSKVRVHTDDRAAESARAVGARAYTAGSAVVFGAGEFTPKSEAGQRLLGHELAHVVQQEASQVQGRGTLADKKMVSHVFVEHRSSMRVQRFTEPGHKLIGDKAFGTEMLQLGQVEMTFGDAVAMGDYFRSFEYMRYLAKTEGKGRNSKGVLLYVLWVKIWGKEKEQKLGVWYDEGAIFQAEQISRGLDSTNISHFPNPRSGDTALGPNQKNQRVGPDQNPLGATATYRKAHEQAMWMAYVNGTKRQSNDDALIADGFACHFLTDSFSAGHLRTPRASIKEYWDKKVPGFKGKLIQWLSDKIAEKRLSGNWVVDLLKRGASVTGFPGFTTPNSTVTSAARSQLSLLLSGADYSFGDVVSLIVHDAEGAAGVEADIEGQRVTLVGDKALVDEKPKDPKKPEGEKIYSLKAAGPAHDTAEAAIKAVKASLEDIYDAYSAGLPEEMSQEAGIGLLHANFGLDLRKTYHHKDFETFRKDALSSRRLYRAEQLIPTAIDDQDLPPDKRTLPWMQPSVEDFLSEKNAVIGKALVSFGEAEGSEFEKRLKQLKGLEPQHKQAIQESLINPLKSGDANCIRVVLKTILGLQGNQAHSSACQKSQPVPTQPATVQPAAAEPSRT